MAKYDVALKVSVSPEDYPKTLAHIYDRKAIVLLVVDLLDFPGSVWPGIIDLLGVNKHIVIIGNKADLLPQVSRILYSSKTKIPTEHVSIKYVRVKSTVFDPSLPPGKVWYYFG